MPATAGLCHQYLPEGADPPRSQRTVDQPTDPDRKLDVAADRIESRVPDKEVDRTGRVAPLELSDDGHDDGNPIVERRGQAQRAGRRAIVGRQTVKGILCFRQHTRTPFVKRPALLGRTDAARGAYQQRSFERAFELGDLLADHRLGDPQSLGCGRERTSLDHLGEIGEPLQIVDAAIGSGTRIVCF
ncbi:hypothetical protein QP185_20700 [Sphingomonas aerolata]